MSGIDPAKVMAEHSTHEFSEGWSCYICRIVTPGGRCLPYRLAQALAAEQAKLAEAERRGAEKAWDECVAAFAALGPVNGVARIRGNVLEGIEGENPYRADAIARGEQP